MHRTYFSRTFTAAAALVICFCIPECATYLMAQSAGDAQAATPILQTNTHAVAVDVVVTKGRDEPVLGLRKQDFVLTEDGKPQTIDFFEEHNSAPKTIAPVPKLPPNVYSNVPPVPESDSVNVLLLDSLNTPREDQIFVHQQVLDFLKSVQPGTRIAIFALGSRLRFIQGFTTDATALQAALNDPKNHTSISPYVSRTRQDDTEDKDTLEQRALATGGGRLIGGDPSRSYDAMAGVQALQDAQRDFAQFQGDRRTEMTLEALRIIARYLGGVPGRKNLIWFATSIPIHFFPAPGESLSFNNVDRYSQQVKDTADLLVLSKVAVYPVGAEGIMNDHWTDPANSGKTGMGGFQNEARDRANRILVMHEIAADTGGEAIYNTNDLKGAVMRAIDNGSHYYTIVYTPANNNMDGQFRKIEIKIDANSSERKSKLSYRRGYYADDVSKEGTRGQARHDASIAPQESQPGAKPDTASADPLRPLLVHGLPSASEVLYAVRVVPAATQPAATAKRVGANDKLTGPTIRYTVDFLIDSKKVQLFTTADGKHAGKIQVGLLAWDHDGKAVNWTGGTMILNMDAALYADVQKTGIRAHAELDLPPGDLSLATGIYDLNAHKAGTLEIPITQQAESKATATAQPSGQ
jgi:VWFA-related protein